MPRKGKKTTKATTKKREQDQITVEKPKLMSAKQIKAAEAKEQKELAEEAFLVDKRPFITLLLGEHAANKIT